VLILRFYLGDEMYVIKCQRIKEIVPMVALKRVPHAPACVAGLFNYRGMIVPVVDLRQFIDEIPCEIRMSTRIILVDYVRDDAKPSIFGIMAERVTEASEKPDSAFIPPSISIPNASYLAGVMMENKEMIQLIDLDRLPDHLQFLTLLDNGIRNAMKHAVEHD
jgi:chemotaxis-related protein WspB